MRWVIEEHPIPKASASRQHTIWRRNFNRVDAPAGVAAGKPELTRRSCKPAFNGVSSIGRLIDSRQYPSKSVEIDGPLKWLPGVCQISCLGPDSSLFTDREENDEALPAREGS
jgi:hypothetical protein